MPVFRTVFNLCLEPLELNSDVSARKFQLQIALQSQKLELVLLREFLQ